LRGGAPAPQVQQRHNQRWQADQQDEGFSVDGNIQNTPFPAKKPFRVMV